MAGKLINFANIIKGLGGNTVSAETAVRETFEAPRRSVIDMSVRLERGDRRVRAAFEWALECLCTRTLDKSDPRSDDLEHIFDCAFGEYANDRTKMDPSNYAVVIEEYFNFWFTLWHKADFYPDVMGLVDRAKTESAILLRFVDDSSLREGDSIEDYLKRNSGTVDIYDTTINSMYQYYEQYCNRSGWILLASPDFAEFPPISIVKSLAVLTRTGIVWTKEKVNRAVEWGVDTDPTMYFFEEEMFTVSRYEPCWQDGRVNADPSEF